MYDLKGPPENGGKPRPKTAPMSPSSGVARIPSWWLQIASFTNLSLKILVFLAGLEMSLHSYIVLSRETQMPSDSFTAATSPFPKILKDLKEVQQKVDFGILFNLQLMKNIGR